VDSAEQLTCLSLCTGYGGIELGLERAGVCLRPIAYVEREAFAAANLVAKIEAGEVAAAPVWTDVKTFPYADFHGRVGILLAGYPCQPFSAAGQRKGAADERHLWPHIAAGIAACQPRLVFCENVEGHLSLGIKDVFNDLDRLGYSYAAGLFSAAEVGATHRRKRLFWLAYSMHARREGRRDFSGVGRQQKLDETWPAGPGQPQHGWEEPRTIVDDSKGGKPKQQPENNRQANGQIDEPRFTSAARRKKESRTVGNAGGAEPDRIPDEPRPDVSEVGQSGQNMVNAGGTRKNILTEKRRSRDNARQGTPSKSNCPARATQRQTEPQLGGTTHGPGSRPDATTNRVDRLRLLGNGVVPQTAAKAFTTLWQQLKN
jgi:DNA (cytosine-5)-methyltransferase 1